MVNIFNIVLFMSKGNLVWTVLLDKCLVIYLEDFKMKPEEYIKTIIYKNRMINIGLDDYGQTYFIEYVEDGELKEDVVGSYIIGYEDYIEWRFGEPEINCPIYNSVVTTDTERCAIPYKPFCDKCRKRNHGKQSIKF